MKQDVSVSRCQFKPGDYVNGKYHVEELLGEGSFGMVYKVSDPQGRLYALKLLPLWKRAPSEREELVQRFRMEFDTGRINSPYLVHSFVYDEVKGNPYIIMEYCRKGNLYKLFEDSKADTSKIFCQILYGLQALHKNGKIHRDLKPENILVKEDNVVALSDFGTSGVITSLTRWQTLFHKADVFGTFAYMAPELFNSKKNKAVMLPTTDIFSFGVVVFELLCKDYPFGSLESEKDLQPYMKNAENGLWNKSKIRMKPELAKWEPVIDGCLNPDYSARFQKIEDVLKVMPQRSMPKNVITVDFNTDLSKGVVLKVMQGEAYGKKYDLNQYLQQDQCIVTGGRLSEDYSNKINISDFDTSYISRRHFTLEYHAEDTHWYIRDGQWYDGHWNNSLNGTYVNSHELQKFEGLPLNAGDIITVGEVKMRVEGV